MGNEPIRVYFGDYFKACNVEDIKLTTYDQLSKNDNGVIMDGTVQIVRGNTAFNKCSKVHDIYISEIVWKLLDTAIDDIDQYDDTHMSKGQCEMWIKKLQHVRVSFSQRSKYLVNAPDRQKYQAIATLITQLIAWLIPSTTIVDGITIIGS